MLCPATGFLFGSEIKAILAAAPELSDVNSQALLQYFYFGYIPDPATAFSAIHKLPPGHLLEFEKWRSSSSAVLGLARVRHLFAGSEEECLDELEAEARRSGAHPAHG